MLLVQFTRTININSYRHSFVSCFFFKKRKKQGTKNKKQETKYRIIKHALNNQVHVMNFYDHEYLSKF